MLIEMSDSKRLPELLAEKDSIDPSFTHALELLTKEINRITEEGESKPNGNNNGKQKLKEPDFINAFTDKRPKVECHLKIPVDEFPGVNFVGKILGPGGSTLKQVQEQTNTGIAILGKGSQRDEKKAQELLESGDTKWAHLRHPLHVQLRAMGPVDQCYMRISHACTELLKLMQVTDDMITDRAKFGGGMGMRGGRGRGQRGGGGRGMGMRGGRGMRGGGGRGGPPGRGGRGGMGRGGRGGGPNKRGRGGGFNKSFGAGDGDEYYTDYPQKPESGYEGYQDQGYGDAGYGDESYGEGYDESYGGDGGYGDGSYGYEGYGGGYGNGGAGDGYGSGASGAAAGKPFRGKASGRGRGRGGNRATPY